jgi:hypothetical protein
MRRSAVATFRAILSPLAGDAGRRGAGVIVTLANAVAFMVVCLTTAWITTAVPAAEPGTAAPGAVASESPSVRPPSPQETMTARGFVRHRGSWRTTQEIELIERAERAHVAQKEWNARLERMRKRLDQPAQAEAAAEEIREISDGFAVPALAAALAAEPQPRVRALYIEALARIRGPEAAQTLVAVAIDHADPETRVLAVERLAAIDAAGAAAAILPALGGGDNGRINRAAAALGRLGSRWAVGPLIEVLETEHVVTADGPPEGSTTATFTPSGGGLALGGGPKRRKVRVHNEQVLEALVALTGVNFDWSVDAWKAWLASRQCPPDFDPRRG